MLNATFIIFFGRKGGKGYRICETEGCYVKRVTMVGLMMKVENLFNQMA